MYSDPGTLNVMVPHMMPAPRLPLHTILRSYKAVPTLPHLLRAIGAENVESKFVVKK